MFLTSRVSQLKTFVYCKNVDGNYSSIPKINDEFKKDKKNNNF